MSFSIKVSRAQKPCQEKFLTKNTCLLYHIQKADQNLAHFQSFVNSNQFPKELTNKKFPKKTQLKYVLISTICTIIQTTLLTPCAIIHSSVHSQLQTSSEQHFLSIIHYFEHKKHSYYIHFCVQLIHSLLVKLNLKMEFLVGDCLRHSIIG